MPVKELRLLTFVSLVAVAGTAAFAQDRPRGLLGATDLKSVVLSPSPLGPAAQFEPPADGTWPALATAKAEAKAEPVAPRKIASIRARSKTAVAARKSKVNPLNSYARDVRPQTWPCTSGGICAWTQPR